MTSLIYIVQGGTEQEQEGLNRKSIINSFLIEWKFKNKKEKTDIGEKESQRIKLKSEKNLNKK